MRNPDRFDIAAFDKHPAYRLNRTFRRHRRPAPVNELRPLVKHVWPLPSLEDCRPCVVGKREDGIAIGYTADSHLPKFLPVFAVTGGAIKYVRKSAGVHSLVLDQTDGHRSFYDGIDHPFVLPGSRHLTEQRVKTGDVLGYVSAPRLQTEALHFELAKRDGRWNYVPVDAGEVMCTWNVLPWTEERDVPPTNVRQIAA